MPSFSFDIKEMKCCHPCLLLILQHCWPSYLNQNKMQHNHLFVLYLHIYLWLIGWSLILQHSCFHSRSEMWQKRSSSRTAHIMKRVYTIGSPTMPNVMFEWLLSRKPAFTVRALFVLLSWHCLNIINVIGSTIHPLNYNEVKLMREVDCDNKC